MVERSAAVPALDDVQLHFGDVTAAVAIMREVAAWGRAQGLRVWPDAWLTEDALLTPEARPQDFCVGRVQGENACAFILQKTDTAFWPQAAEAEAVYLHKFCVRRAFAHSGMTARVTAALRGYCKARGIACIRLDTGLAEDKVRGIYEAAGFVLADVIRYADGRGTALYQLTV